MGEVVLAACAEGQGILGTDLRSGALVATFDEAFAQPGAFGTIGGGTRHIFAAQAKKAVFQVWGWGERKACYRGSLPERLTAMAFSGDGALCFGGAVSGSIYAWQTSTGCLLRCWPAHFREVTQLLLSEDGSFLVSASADSSVSVWNLADLFCDAAPKAFHSWTGHSLAVTALALLPGSGGMHQVVASASLDRSVRLWDVASGRPLLSRPLAAPVLGLATSPSGELLCACKNGELRAIRPQCTAEEGDGMLIGHTGPVLGCDVSADGSCAASCSEADRVRIWELRTRQCISQAHTSRSVQVGAVKIVARPAQPQGLPPFQPFQRLLTAPAEAPAVPLCTRGRWAMVKAGVQAHATSEAFVDRFLWSCGGGEVAGAPELAERCATAEASAARWARVAADLYDLVVDAETDASKPPAPPARRPDEELRSLRSLPSLGSVSAAEGHVVSAADAVAAAAVEEAPAGAGDAEEPRPASAKRKKRKVVK